MIGASDGIGKACAEKFIKNGDEVFNVSRHKSDVCTTYFADITKEAEREAAFRALSCKISKIDVLLYFAGVSLAAPVEKIDRSDYAYLYDVNVFGFIETVKFALPYLKKAKGKIVAASSLAAKVPIVFDGFYSSSKVALDALCEATAIETRPFGVRVTSLHIGGCNTDFTFKRKIYSAEMCSDAYALNVLTAAKNLAQIEQKGFSPAKAAKKIYSLSCKKHPPLYKSVGINCGIAVALEKILPRKATLYVAAKFQLKQKPRFCGRKASAKDGKR